MGAMRLTLDLPETLGADIAALAAAEGRSPEAVALEVLAWRMDDLRSIGERYERSEADIAAGRLLDHGSVMAGLDALIDEAEAKRGR